MSPISQRPPTPGEVEFALGMMSGTSGDGIDAALIQVRWTSPSTANVRVLSDRHVPFEASLRERILQAASRRQLSAEDVARLHAALGDAYASAVISIGAKPSVIGLHGQTLAHLPSERVTFQLGDAARVAVRTGIPTVADFRSADVAAGGEGAPLTPFADHVLFSDGAPRVVLNLGGIANVTLLPDPDPDHVTGWDTGPANIVLDAVARMAGQPFDEGGAGAKRGRVISAALERALAHPFFARKPPKSTGREEFGNDFALRLVADVRQAGGSNDDALATAAALTARSVAASIRAAAKPRGGWRDVIVGGGGSKNRALMDALAQELTPVPVRPSDDLAIPATAREAVCFAVLALFRIRGLPNTLPRVTGASRAVSAGAVHDP